MKKIITVVIALMLLITLSSTAFAASAPSAMSFFSNSTYNRIYTDNGGIKHTVKAYQVTETHSKVGSLMYIIRFDDTSKDKAGNTYIIDDSATKIYFNACTKYPEATHQVVFRKE